MGNAILFPAPAATYSCFTEGLQKRLVWIAEDIQDRCVQDASPSTAFSSSSKCRKFPALFFGSSGSSSHTLLYFHGNSADLGDIFDEMELLHRYCGCNILAIEFPGYGVCNKVTANPAAIDLWGRAAFNWLIRRGASPMAIIPFGRSIGTGPAAKLAASLKNEAIQTGGLILHSPYASIHKIIQDYTSIGTWIIGNHWNTEQALHCLSPTTPLLIIHGENDEVIPVKHGKTLYNGFKADTALKEGFFPADSPHNAYLIIDHLASPIKQFLETKSLSRRVEPQYFQLLPEDRKTPTEYLRSPYRPPKCCGPVAMDQRSSLQRGSSSLLLSTKRGSGVLAPDPSSLSLNIAQAPMTSSYDPSGEKLMKEVPLRNHSSTDTTSSSSYGQHHSSGRFLSDDDDHDDEVDENDDVELNDSPRPSRSIFCSCYPEKGERCEVIIP